MTERFIEYERCKAMYTKLQEAFARALKTIRGLCREDLQEKHPSLCLTTFPMISYFLLMKAT